MPDLDKQESPLAQIEATAIRATQQDTVYS
jgi:hypothetical protein